MGGFGSGGHFSARRKRTVKECQALDIFSLNRHSKSWLITGNFSTFLTWTDQTGALQGTAYYAVSNDKRGPFITIHYSLNKGKESIEKNIQLDKTFPYFGGARYWFICPQENHGMQCRQRVAKLYILPGGKYFGCRHCYHLSYKSSQDSHKYDKLFRSIGADIGLSAHRVKELF